MGCAMHDTAATTAAHQEQPMKRVASHAIEATTDSMISMMETDATEETASNATATVKSSHQVLLFDQQPQQHHHSSQQHKPQHGANTSQLKHSHSALVKLLESAPLSSISTSSTALTSSVQHHHYRKRVKVVDEQQQQQHQLAAEVAGDDDVDMKMDTEESNCDNQQLISNTSDSSVVVAKDVADKSLANATDGGFKSAERVCPWKKTRIAREWRQHRGDSKEQSQTPNDVVPMDDENVMHPGAAENEVDEDEDAALHLEADIEDDDDLDEDSSCDCAIKRMISRQRRSTCCSRRNSSDSSESSTSQHSQDSGCDSDCPENNISELCKQFDQNLSEDGFFRRSIQQKIQYRPCTKNQQCSILRINRNRCQYCRLKKCIAVGMSRDAVRFGRVPKREKARILAAMQQSTQNRGQQRALATELDDQPRLLSAVLRAHMDTCEFTREKVSDMRRRARDCPTYSMPTLACPLNPAPELQSEQEFSQRFAHVIRGVIDFAGMIPGFQLLTQDDKFTLLKAGLFDALFVRLICMFDSSINSIICLNGQVMRRDSIQNGANARFLVDSTFNFAERMNAMNLTDAEIGLFCAIVLITPDRPGLRNLELIEKMYTRLKACLQSVINQNRPNQPDFMTELLNTLPDLRTLSTLHTEKLVVFRTEHKELLRQQMWTGDDDDGGSTKSPGSSTWGCENTTIEDIAKSPMGSVSSTESSDTVSEYQSMSSSAPLLAATLSGGCPLRMRANSGSSAEDDIVGAAAAHLTQNGLTITPVVRTANGNVIPSSIANGHHSHHHHIRYRKLDSPTDSGIESGNEKADHKVASSGSSSCSSPRSSVEDASEDKRHIVEDMPVLKRVLQAPPLYDTNSLMDEAYKPHKKFRALRHRDSCGSTTSSTSSGHQVSSNENSAEAEPMQIHLSNNNNNNNTSSNNNNQYNNNSGMFHPVAGVMVGQTTPTNHTQSQLHMHLTRPQHSHNHTQSPSSLSSTHSVLAKSLMEEPRMTPEQMKRSDIIQNYIMRESAAEQMAGHHAAAMHSMCPYSGSKLSASTSTQQQGLLVCAAATSTPNQTPSPKPPQTPPTVLSSSPSLASACPYSGTARWSAAVSASVITATSTSTPSPPPSQQQPTITVIPAAAASSSSSSSSSSRYFQSPHSTSSSLSVVSQSPSPRLLELQVEIANAGDAPLNLSKKSPSPTPPPPPTSSSNPSASSASSSSSAAVTITQQQQSRTLPATAGTTTIHKVLLEA